MMAYLFDLEKDEMLKAGRGIGFEEIIWCIHAGQVIRVMKHSNAKKYPRQFIYEVYISGYVWRVPHIDNGDAVFLKTAYPSRKATRHYRKGETI